MSTTLPGLTATDSPSRPAKGEKDCNALRDSMGCGSLSGAADISTLCSAHQQQTPSSQSCVKPYKISKILRALASEKKNLKSQQTSTTVRGSLAARPARARQLTRERARAASTLYIKCLVVARAARGSARAAVRLFSAAELKRPRRPLERERVPRS